MSRDLGSSQPVPCRSQSSASSAWAIFSAGFVGSLIIFLATLASGVVWGDSAKLTLYALTGEPQWGSIAGHPLHSLAGMVALQLWPFGNPAWVINALSAVMAALSVGLAGLIAQQLSSSAAGEERPGSP